MKHPVEKIRNGLLTFCADPMPAPCIHGLLSALNCTLNPVPPAVWLQSVFNIDPSALQSSEDMQKSIYYLQNLLQQIGNDLMGEKYEPFFGKEENGSRRWAEGFLFGLSLGGIPSDPKTKDIYVELMTPVIILANPEEVEKNKKKIDAEEGTDSGPDLKELAMGKVSEAVIHLNQLARQIQLHAGHNHPEHDHGHSHDHSDQPNRNDLCSCGSGKKYKHCCGRS